MDKTFHPERFKALHPSTAPNDTDQTEEEKTYTTDELTKEFKVIAFSAPYVEVVRKSDGKRGTMRFNHRPRVYFDFQPI